jgi:hypothetical protein
VSGQVGRFHSLEELLAFMIRVLTEVWCVRKLCPRMWTCYLVKSPNRVVWAVTAAVYSGQAVGRSRETFDTRLAPSS